jgi:hypothetical protein
LLALQLHLQPNLTQETDNNNLIATLCNILHLLHCCCCRRLMWMCTGVWAGCAVRRCMAPPASSRRASQSEQQATVILRYITVQKAVAVHVFCATVGRYGSSCTLLAVLSSALATGSRATDAAKQQQKRPISNRSMLCWYAASSRRACQNEQQATGCLTMCNNTVLYLLHLSHAAVGHCGNQTLLAVLSPAVSSGSSSATNAMKQQRRRAFSNGSMQG